jgi:nucleotide-binding universal stress UspA family protein
MYEEMERSVHGWAQRRLDALIEQARRSGVTARALLLSDPAAHEAIARAASRERSDVIVVGTHGRTGLERVFVGSVAARIIGTAPCPVLTVRSRRSRRT